MADADRLCRHLNKRALDDQNVAAQNLANIMGPLLENDAAAPRLQHLLSFHAEPLPHMARAVRIARKIKLRRHMAEIIAWRRCQRPAINLDEAARRRLVKR